MVFLPHATMVNARVGTRSVTSLISRFDQLGGSVGTTLLSVPAGLRFRLPSLHNLRHVRLRGHRSVSSDECVLPCRCTKPSFVSFRTEASVRSRHAPSTAVSARPACEMPSATLVIRSSFTNTASNSASLHAFPRRLQATVATSLKHGNHLCPEHDRKRSSACLHHCSSLTDTFDRYHSNPNRKEEKMGAFHIQRSP